MTRNWHYVDLHTHILPGVDDGSQNLKNSMKMLDEAYEEGIRMMVCTPHYGQRNPGLKQEVVIEKFSKFVQQAKERYPEMSFFLGNELFYKQGIIRDVLRGRAFGLAGTKALLVEFSNKADYALIDKCVHEFTSIGYKPLLAHVERYEALLGNVGAVQGLKNMGAFIQVNADSFVRDKGSKRGQFAAELLKAGCVDVIASDCHDCKHRAPVMDTAVEEMIKLVGTEKVFEIVNTNVKRILKGEA